MDSATGKRKVLNRLIHLRNSLVMGFAAEAMLHDPRAREILAPVIIQLSDISIPLQQIAVALAEDEAREQVCFEFRKLVVRAATAEPFEVLEKYASLSKQTAAFEAAPWYPFAKLLRNTIRHGTVEFTPYLRARLPIEYGNIIVTAADEGRSLEGFVDYADAIRLVDAMYRYLDEAML